MSFFTNESMLDTQQLREIIGKDVIDGFKTRDWSGDSDRRYGEFPSDGSPWGLGKGADLINWNYDEAKGIAENPTINLDERCRDLLSCRHTRH